MTKRMTAKARREQTINEADEVKHVTLDEARAMFTVDFWQRVAVANLQTNGYYGYVSKSHGDRKVCLVLR